MTQLDIYELDSDSTAIDQAPGLIGPDALAKWQGNIYFTDDTVEVFGPRGKKILPSMCYRSFTTPTGIWR